MSNRIGIGSGGRIAATLILLLNLIATGFAQPPASPVKAISKKPQQTRLRARVFQSASLGRPMHYRILLPAKYMDSSRRFPVLYLLHGWHGDYKNWSMLTKLVKYADSLAIIIVMPDAEDSWYANSATESHDKFETYMVRDVIDDVDLHWRTLASADQRAIAGLSMGGYGAVKFGLKYSDRFRFVGSLSGAFNATNPELRQSRSDLAPSLDAAFGKSRTQMTEEEDIFKFVETVRSSGSQYFYIDCGTRDSDFLQANRDFVALIGQRKFAYEYHETPGDHSWQYWDSRLPNLLDVVTHVLAGSNSVRNEKGK